jgi:hypothetical protein
MMRSATTMHPPTASSTERPRVWQLAFWETVPCARVGLLVGLLLFAAGSPPFLYAWLSTPADKLYTGLMFDVPDHAQYWSWVTASKHGLFIANTMTPEPNPPIFLNPMMWSLAQLQQAAGLCFASLFQVWRLLACLVLGVALVKGIRAFVPDRTRRGAAYAMAIVGGGGLAWILIAAKYARHLGDVPFPQDLYTVEPNTFFASFAYPYLALAQGLLLLTFLGAWLVHRHGSIEGYVLAIGAAVALALTHAYDLISVYAVLAAFWLFETVRTRKIPVRLTMAGIAIGVASGPIAVYYQRLTASDPLWQALLRQYANAGVWTPPHFHLVLLMGIPLLLAIFSLGWALKSRGPESFIAVWAIVGLALIYLPVVFQIKLLTAWQFPIAILAAHAWHQDILPSLSRMRPLGSLFAQRRAIGLALLIALIIPTNLYLYVWRFTELRRHERPYYLHKDEMAALEWLSSHTGPEDVVIAPLEIGQFVPNYGGTRAFLAHWAMTNRFFERREQAALFFNAATPDDYRQAVLDRNGVTLVLQTTAPGDDGAPRYDPQTSPLFDPIFVKPNAAIFRYRPSVQERVADARR